MLVTCSEYYSSSRVPRRIPISGFRGSHCTMPTSPVPEGRRSKRIAGKKRASLVLHVAGKQERVPGLVVDATERGFRVQVNFRLRRGQVVELILDEDPLSTVWCNVVWIGKAGTKEQGQVGLETV